MIVKIKHDDWSSVYDATRYDIHQGSGLKAHLTIKDREGEEHRMTVHKGECEVYVSNDRGETMDSYRWAVRRLGVEFQDGEPIYTGQEIEVYMGDSGDGSEPQQWHRATAKMRDGRAIADFHDTETVASKSLSPVKAKNLRKPRD